ncbi:MAG: type II CAAX endopeptidase family protein [Gammaproteobacteria bacterium]
MQPSPSRRQQLIELCVFLLLIVPAMFLSLAAVRPEQLNFPLVALSSSMTDLAMVALVLYFIWSNREGFASIGWTKRNLGRELAIGGALFVPFFIGVGLVARMFEAAGLSAPAGPPGFLLPHGPYQMAGAFGFLVVVAVSEETIFRGYLLKRFWAVTGNRTAAIVLSSLVFAIGHGYEGSAGVATVGLMGVVFCVIYLWRGSLVAAIALHFLQDLVSLMLPALAGSH